MISVEKANAIATAIGSDEERVKMLFDLSPEEAAEKLNSEGNDVTAQDLIDFADFVKENAATEGELAEDDLGNVSGGVVAELVFCGGVLLGMYLNNKGTW